LENENDYEIRPTEKASKFRQRDKWFSVVLNLVVMERKTCAENVA
jgi:hypothetical protein